MRAVRPIRTRLVSALAVLALASTAASCASEEPEASDDPTPTESSSATTDPTGPTEATDSPSEEPSPVDDGAQVDVEEFVARLEAGIEKTEQAHIEFTMSGAGGEMAGNGDVSYQSDPPDMQMSMKVGPESVAMLLVGGTMYVRSSQAGGKYVAFDLSDPSNPLGSGFAEQLDPAASMESFTKALSAVVSAGREDVGGQSLDRYDLTVDTTLLPDQPSAGQLPADMQVTVWLDKQDRMARTSMNMGAIVYEATLTDFDKPVDLQPPPDDEVASPPAG